MALATVGAAAASVPWSSIHSADAVVHVPGPVARYFAVVQVVLVAVLLRRLIRHIHFDVIKLDIGFRTYRFQRQHHQRGKQSQRDD